MKIYVDEDKINILQTVASASTMISSVAGIAKEYILSKFEPGYFKNVYIDTSETSIQQDRNALYNASANKIPYPSMTITPEISLDSPIGGMEKSLFLSSPNLFIRRNSDRYYRKLVVDPDNDFSISYTGDYITTNFLFKITTNSFVSSTDVAFFLKSKFQTDFFQYLNNQFLQTEIPKSFIKMIADMKQWDLTNNDDMDALRLYLIGTSRQPEYIQKKISLTTGQQCFFVNDTVNLLTLFTDLDCPSSINRDSQIEGEYVITFRFQVSTYLTNAFILSISKDALKGLSLDTVKHLEDHKNQQESGIIGLTITKPILNKKEVKYFTDNSGAEQIGHLIFDDVYTFELHKSIPKIYLMEKINKEVVDVYNYAKNFLHIDTSALLCVQLYSNIGKISEQHYIVNYDELSIQLSNHITNDVSISILLNRTLFESIKKSMELDTNFFASNLLTTVIANIAGEDVRVVIKSFKSDTEEYLPSLDKCLRINTAYGIGYISLLDDSECDDAYKICVGYDSNNEPIIKQFEIYS